MKKVSMFLVAAVVAVSVVSVAMASGAHKVAGEVVKAEGEFVEVKDSKGKVHKLHIAESTKKTGEIKAGAHVEAEADASGHALAITAKDMMAKDAKKAH